MSQTARDQLLGPLFGDASVDHLRKLQRLALQTEGFDASASSVRHLESVLDTSRPTDLIAELAGLPWYMAICPRFHFVEARIREALGEMELMEAAVSRMQNCLRALLKTGQGTRDCPYFITFATDQRDIMRAIGEPVRCQQTLQDADRLLDVLTAHSGVEVWFDVTAPLQCRRPHLSSPASAMMRGR